MDRFAPLLDSLVFTPSRLGKLRLLSEYFTTTPDPDRGWALAALTGALSFRGVKPAQIRALTSERVDEVLFALSYDYVGDLAETVALIWPSKYGGNYVPRLSEVVEGMAAATRDSSGALLGGWLDALDATGRWALLKLATGALRVGISARLAKTALAEGSHVSLDEIEAVWHGLRPPYTELFAWLAGHAARPEIGNHPTFTPLMLAQPLEEEDIARLDPTRYRAEWKWDGIRVQLVGRGGERRLYSRSGDDIGAAFPDLLATLDEDVVLDGELLVLRDGVVAPFNDLQQRLNRKLATPKMIAEYPAWLRLYDILEEGGADLRALSFDERRRRLETWYRAAPRPQMDISPLLSFSGWEQLREFRDGARARAIEGLMLKRGDSTYVSGRPKGPWFKWKRDALTVDTVLMYAQRGHGKRSSFYSDYTFGVWHESELVPVGKAYSGFTDQELKRLDGWIRDNTIERFGPVRAVTPQIVVEVAFDSIHPSTRHKSGLAMRFPRIHRIRWDKPAAEADQLISLAKLVS